MKKSNVFGSVGFLSLMILSSGLANAAEDCMSRPGIGIGSGADRFAGHVGAYAVLVQDYWVDAATNNAYVKTAAPLPGFTAIVSGVSQGTPSNCMKSVNGSQYNLFFSMSRAASAEMVSLLKLAKDRQLPLNVRFYVDYGTQCDDTVAGQSVYMSCDYGNSAEATHNWDFDVVPSLLSVEFVP